MKLAGVLCWIASLVAIALGIFVAWNSSIPLGIPGEWVWNRSKPPDPFGFIWVILAGVLYTAFCVFGWHRHQRIQKTSFWFLLLLLPIAAIMQWTLITLPMPGPERWLLSLHSKSTSGYFTEAKAAYDAGQSIEKFLRNYEKWIATQDSFHIGTHPPGLFVMWYLAYAELKARPAAAAEVEKKTPERISSGKPLVRDPLTTFDFSTLIVAAFATWLSGILAAPLVYSIALRGAGPASAWLAACLWILLPAQLLFLPLADSLYPLFAAGIVSLVLGSTAVSIRFGWLSALLAGVIWFVAMTMSLAFLVVLPIAFGPALIAAIFSRRWIPLVVAGVSFLVGAGICVAAIKWKFDLDLISVWITNLEKHRGFYEHMPRTYWKWIGVNFLEYLIVVGVPLVFAVFSALIGSIRKDRLTPAIALAFVLTLLLLDLTGKNLSEVARLWLFLAPVACAAAGPAIDRFVTKNWHVVLLLAMQWSLIVSLVANVEPLLPIAVG